MTSEANALLSAARGLPSGDNAVWEDRRIIWKKPETWAPALTAWLAPDFRADAMRRLKFGIPRFPPRHDAALQLGNDLVGHALIETGAGMVGLMGRPFFERPRVIARHRSWGRRSGVQRGFKDGAKHPAERRGAAQAERRGRERT